MSETREFPVGVLYTMATGRLMAPFDPVHGAIEFLLGGPVWTHQLAMPSVFEAIEREVSRQHPRLREWDAGPSPEDRAAADAWAREKCRELAAFIGSETLPITPLEGWRQLSPFEGIPEGIEPIVLVKDR